jgi:hypothetical protein
MIKHRDDFVTCSCAVLVGALLCPVVLAEERINPPEPPKAPDGWVFIDEDAWEIVPDTTGRHLHEARQAFVAERYQDAASEIRKAAAVILFDGRRETDVQAKEALMDAVLDLERIANNVEQHVAYSRTLLNHTFARAECALAKHDILAVRNAWQGGKRDMLRIGGALDAAATHVDGGFLWAGSDIERGAIDAISRAMSIADALEEGSYSDGKQIQAAMEGIEREVQELGKIVDSFPRVTEGDTTAHKAAPLPAPDGFVLVEDDVWFVNLDEPGKLLHQARADYTNTNYIMAATDLREASVYLRIEGRRAGEPGIKDALFSSADDLRALAKDIDRGEYIPSNRFCQTSARVHYNLARANQQAASDAWAKKDTERARQSLNAAMTNLKQGFVWAGHEMEASAVDFSRKVESLCAKMAKTAGWEDKEVEEAVKFVGVEVSQLGKEL